VGKIKHQKKRKFTEDVISSSKTNWAENKIHWLHRQLGTGRRHAHRRVFSLFSDLRRL